MNQTEENTETGWNVDAIWKRAENPDVDPAFYIASGIWLSIIFCIGVGCNGSVLYAYLKNTGVCMKICYLCTTPILKLGGRKIIVKFEVQSCSTTSI